MKCLEGIELDRSVWTRVFMAAALLSMVGCGDDNRSGPEAAAGISGGGNGGVGGAAGIAGGGAAPDAGGTGGIAGDVGGSGGSGGIGGSGGSGGVGGSGGTGGTGGTGGSPVVRPKCLQSDSQVIVIGDSYINWSTHTMPQDFVAVTGQTWRMYAIGGASMASGGVAGFIPDQFETAVRADPNITTVVMDGGGNDILIPNGFFLGGGDCKNLETSPTLPVCQMIVQLAVDRANALMDRGVDVGVKDVIYFFYPHVPEGTIIGGAKPNAILDYAYPLVRGVCDGAEARTAGKLRCHFVDTIPIFEGHTDWFAAADIHENAMGSMAIAQAIWQTMQDNCIAQKSPNTCCDP